MSLSKPESFLPPTPIAPHTFTPCGNPNPCPPPSHTSPCHPPANPCQPPVEPQTDAVPVLTAACCAASPDLLVDPCLELSLFQDSEKRPLLVERPGPCASSRVVFTLKPSLLPSHLRLVMALNSGLALEPESGIVLKSRVSPLTVNSFSETVLGC